jgi:hypothetical protein
MSKDSNHEPPCGFEDLKVQDDLIVCPICGFVRTKDWLRDVVARIGERRAVSFNAALIDDADL